MANVLLYIPCAWRKVWFGVLLLEWTVLFYHGQLLNQADLADNGQNNAAFVRLIFVDNDHSELN